MSASPAQPSEPAASAPAQTRETPVLTPGEEDALGPTRKLARGLQAARGIEATQERLRVVRDRLGQGPHRRMRTKTRKQAKRLARVLENLQETVLAYGLDKRAFTQLIAHLEPVDAQLENLSEPEPSKKVLRQARAALRSARHALQD